MTYLGSLIFVLVVELALGPQVSAFSIARPQVTDLAVAASEPMNVNGTSLANAAPVLPLTIASGTPKPIETTAKTEEIQNNATETTLKDSRSTTLTYTGSTDLNNSTNQNETLEVRKGASTTAAVNSYTSSSEDSSKNTRQSTEDMEPVASVMPVNFEQHEVNSIDTTTEADNATSYSAELVPDTSETLSSSTAKDMKSGTSSSKLSQDKAGLNAKQKGDTNTAVPLLMKQKAKDVKRFTEKDMTTTEIDEDLIKSAQSHISLEKAFSISSDIPSLEKLKNDLLSISTKIPNNSPTTSSPVNEVIPTTDKLKPTSTNAIPVSSSDHPRSDTMSSKRAGFLDYTSRTSGNVLKKTVEPNITNNVVETTAQPITTTTSTIDTTEEVKSITNKSNSETTNSQLVAEDELNEELMKESKARNEVYETNKNPITTSTTLIEGGADLTSEENSSHDKLSVKPITSDKTKTMMYAVSPNYRPMKKIEVQPPKIFARDPDDNSWRNESLSSLGIVFKANNSTKPFTQVLKNKTETELNSLLDKYNKNSEQELRERLEKMSEKRKSKKKKVDKNGDVTYVDYEESNSGEMAPKGERYLTPLIPPLHEVTPLPSPPEVQNIFSSNFDLELNKTTHSNGTKNNKKVIETFDADDEDPDYITMPAQDIDIKKYMNLNDQTTASPPTTSKPSFPERKATVQYFPPLQKKANFDDYDDNYRDRINSNTPRNFAKNVPTPFTTPLPTAGDYGKKIATTNTHTPRRLPDFDESDFKKDLSIVTNLKEFMKDVIKVENEGYVPPAPIPSRAPIFKPPGDYFDYDTHFRKNIIDKFMEHYNAQNEKYNVDYPVLYNSSIVHSMPDSGTIEASSNAFMRRMFDDVLGKMRSQNKADPDCDRTVELSPAYELHYFVPDDFVPEDGLKHEPPAPPPLHPKESSPLQYRV